MRINVYLAQYGGLSRRSADRAIAEGRVKINGSLPQLGQPVNDGDRLTLDGKLVEPTALIATIAMHKPVGYVVSRAGQGSRTVYDLLPSKYHNLKPIGRLDKDSSGILLLTNDGALANELTHPRYQKQKIYHVTIDKSLAPADETQLNHGVRVEDYTSHLTLSQPSGNRQEWQVTMSEGKNRQIRRTFERLGYTVTRLHRVAFGEYRLSQLAPGDFKEVTPTLK